MAIRTVVISPTYNLSGMANVMVYFTCNNGKNARGKVLIYASEKTNPRGPFTNSAQNKQEAQASKTCE